MTATTAASMRLGLSFVSLASRAPGESSRKMALPTCQASRLSPVIDLDYEQDDRSGRPAIRINVGQMRRPGH
jgi:hypothetical protein